MDKSCMPDTTHCDVSQSEYYFRDQWNSCLISTVGKTVGGFVVGLGIATLIFKGKKWPCTLGAGFGTGWGLTNCRRMLNEPFLVPVDIVIKDPAASRG